MACGLGQPNCLLGVRPEWQCQGSPKLCATSIRLPHPPPCNCRSRAGLAIHLCTLQCLLQCWPCSSSLSLALTELETDWRLTGADVLFHCQAEELHCWLFCRLFPDITKNLERPLCSLPGQCGREVQAPAFLCAHPRSGHSCHRRRRPGYRRPEDGT